MTRRENHRRNRERHGREHNPAEQENYRRNYRKSQRAEQRVFLEANRPYQAVSRNQSAVRNQIKRQRALKKPAEMRVRNIDNHKSETTESSNLLQNFNRFVYFFIFKSVLAFYRKNNVRYHYNCYKNQSIKIKPTHNYTR